MGLVVANQTLVVTSFCWYRRRRSTSLSRLRYRDPTKGVQGSAEELGWAAARQQLHHEQLRLRRLGAEVHGEVGEPDPVAAIKEVLGGHQVDEIILSTLPQRRSRGLRGTCRVGSGAPSGWPVTPVLARRPTRTTRAATAIAGCRRRDTPMLSCGPPMRRQPRRTKWRSHCPHQLP